MTGLLSGVLHVLVVVAVSLFIFWLIVTLLGGAIDHTWQVPAK